MITVIHFMYVYTVNNVIESVEYIKNATKDDYCVYMDLGSVKSIDFGSTLNSVLSPVWVVESRCNIYED